MSPAIQVPRKAGPTDDESMLRAMFAHALWRTTHKLHALLGTPMPDQYVPPVMAGAPDGAPDPEDVKNIVASLRTYANPLQPNVQELSAALGNSLTSALRVMMDGHAHRQTLFDSLEQQFEELFALQQQMAEIAEREWARWGGGDKPRADPLLGSVEHAPHWLIAGLQGRHSDAAHEELQQQTALVRSHVNGDIDARCRRILAKLRVNAALRWMTDAVHRKTERLMEQVLALRQWSEPSQRAELMGRIEQLGRMDETAHTFGQDGLRALDQYERALQTYWREIATLYVQACVAIMRKK